MEKLLIVTEIIQRQLRLVVYSSIFSKLCLLLNSLIIGLKFQCNESENTSSPQIVDDLLIEIIQRVPLKQTVQLRLVSKYWSSLILDPKLRLLRNRPTVGLIFEVLENNHWNTTSTYSYIISLDKSISPPIRKLTPTRDTWYRHCKILHSCNGLLLCARNYLSLIKYYVCNPTTRKYIALPEVVFDHSRVSIRGMYLAFDPSKSPHYKVVCVLRSSDDKWLHLFDVYSSKTGSWRKGGELFKVDVDFDFEDGVYWNGAIHWINIIVARPRESVYFSIDGDQTPKIFPNPPLQDESYDKNDYYFGESCDHLHFVDAYRTLYKFIVYEMKKDYSEWFVKYNVNVPEIRIDYYQWLITHKVNVPGYYESSFLRNEVIVRIYTVVRGKNDDDSFLVIATGRRRIARYNIKHKTFETLFDLKSTVKDRSVFWDSKRMFQYIESICSV